MDLRTSLRRSRRAAKRSRPVGPVGRVGQLKTYPKSCCRLGRSLPYAPSLGHRDKAIAGRERYLERESLPQRRGVFHALRRGHRLAPGDAHSVLELWFQGAARRTSPRTDASCMFAMPPLWEGSSSVWGLRARAYAPPESSRSQNPASTLACDRKVSRR